MSKVTLNDSAFRAKLLSAVLRGARQVGIEGQTDIRRSINVSNAGGDQPSAPGEPPRKVTQTLSKSIATVTARNGAGIKTEIGSNVPYARHLEFGTSKMEARPFLRPALQRLKTQVLDILKIEVERSIR